MIKNEILSAIIISILHGLIPSHWLPVLVLQRNFNWKKPRLYWVATQAAFFHSISTIIIGICIALLGKELQAKMQFFTNGISGSLLILIGIWFLFRHYHHHHFHIEKNISKSESRIIFSLCAAMFFAPCLEIAPQYLLIGSKNFYGAIWLSLLYLLITIGSMILWVGTATTLLKRIDSHKWEHNIGIASGVILILTGITSFFIH